MSGGTLSPGVPDATGRGNMGVTGGVTFAANSTLRITANGDGTASRLFAAGLVTLDGTVDVRAGGTFAPSTQYNLLTAGGGLSGTFSAVTSSLLFLTPLLTYDTNTNNVFLTLNCNDPTACRGVGTGGGPGGGGTGGGGGGGGPVNPGFGFAAVARTRNQNAVATALDASPFTNPLVNALLTQATTVAGAQQAFDALSGEVFGSVQNAQAGQSQFTRDAMLGRMRQASYAGAPGAVRARSASAGRNWLMQGTKPTLPTPQTSRQRRPLRVNPRAVSPSGHWVSAAGVTPTAMAMPPRCAAASAASSPAPMRASAIPGAPVWWRAIRARISMSMRAPAAPASIASSSAVTPVAASGPSMCAVVRH